MRFYTQPECEEWLRSRGRSKPDEAPGLVSERIAYPAEPYRFYFLARWIATELPFRSPTLLWITEWGIWPSSENWHLYHTLRESRGDHRLLHEAPGHLFLDYESEELASFLQISMLNGWDGYVLTGADYVNVFFSHDEFIDFYARRDTELDDIRKVLGPTPPAK
jgi:hypothetical protein